MARGVISSYQRPSKHPISGLIRYVASIDGCTLGFNVSADAVRSSVQPVLTSTVSLLPPSNFIYTCTASRPSSNASDDNHSEFGHSHIHRGIMDVMSRWTWLLVGWVDTESRLCRCMPPKQRAGKSSIDIKMSPSSSLSWYDILFVLTTLFCEWIVMRNLRVFPILFYRYVPVSSMLFSSSLLSLYATSDDSVEMNRYLIPCSSLKLKRHCYYIYKNKVI